jgi:hypothetical protein
LEISEHRRRRYARPLDLAFEPLYFAELFFGGLIKYSTEGVRGQFLHLLGKAKEWIAVADGYPFPSGDFTDSVYGATAN